MQMQPRCLVRGNITDTVATHTLLSISYLLQINFQTMAEAAGLVLGVIPLVFYALDKYQDCLEFGRSYKKYEDTLTSIRDEVFVQQMLFHNTMETMGLSEPNYAELEECLQNRFPENHEQFMRYIKRMAATIDLLMAKLEVDVNSNVSPFKRLRESH
jgi:hypothetical protein